MIDKFSESVMAAVERIPSGASIAIGGFGSSGRPDTLIHALAELDRRDLHIISNNVGTDATGIGRLVVEGRVRRMTASFPMLPAFYADYFAGKIELELIPQGTLAERLRAGGAGIAAFLTPSGAHTMLTDGTFPLGYASDGSVAAYVPARETTTIDGRDYVLEYGIAADFALVHAHRGDRKGNLRFNRSARNFNPAAAMSGRYTIAEVENLVGVDAIDPDDVHLAGVFVSEIVLAGAADAQNTRKVEVAS